MEVAILELVVLVAAPKVVVKRPLWELVVAEMDSMILVMAMVAALT
mgnify:CR=1 FL=1